MCFNCHAPGHRRPECPRPEAKRWRTCDRCHLQGHKPWACTDLWRRYHAVVPGVAPADAPPADDYQGPLVCFTCGGTGHLGVYCTRPRPEFTPPVSYPLVVDYDWTPGATRAWRRPQLAEVIKKLAYRHSKAGGPSRGAGRDARPAPLARHAAAASRAGLPADDPARTKGVPHTSTRLKQQRREERSGRRRAPGGGDGDGDDEATAPGTPAAEHSHHQRSASSSKYTQLAAEEAAKGGAPPEQEADPRHQRKTKKKKTPRAGSRRALRAEKRAAENAAERAAKREKKAKKFEQRRLASGLIVG